MDLDGHKLSSWQRGRRRYAIESKYQYIYWHPPNLLSTCLRRAIVQLSSGLDRAQVTQQAVSLFIAQAKNPGLDVRPGTNTYTLAMDFCATIRTILAYLERITLVTLTQIPDKQITPDISWSFLAHQDESGLLHRWVFVDRIDDNTVIAELHKWETIADIIVHDSPMMLHFTAIGQTINGRRYSPWCRAYKSPLINGQIRFRKKTGQLTANWEPFYLADNPKNSPDTWIDQLLEDDVHESLMLHKTVAVPDKFHIDNFYRDVQYEAQQIQNTDLTDPLALPMCRVSCDIPFACPHQSLCYSTTVKAETCDLYRAR